ncbi:glycosyltransferase family 8 protein [Aaosphaeria arxii CBS 175.79]|uniref:Glycosyltransferase family 8 protein n=1 Tax=Aaosphaeria arxii CBS 175.79 TaxID=1450172 RepID=A0A6A5XS06_9PLEO|nr:glycosyltransferase family 8 protein [Aaosphaeria arxii CBS 175.79]KAF2015541.1 glycosyltransferase family 8 protein [Aaosphaeria arxii CBS 175.79]
MGKLLLTSGQVSVLLSSCIVLIFTVVLFFSGYVLQQRTVHSLQAAIRPTRPKPLPVAEPIAPPTLDVKWARPVGSRPNVDESVEQYLAGETMDWSRLGYVQMARDHSELCSAIMILADVHKMKSPARKILLFPRSWLKKTEGDEYDADMSTTRRLLRTAARRYGVSLNPMETITKDADESLPSSYSLASMYSLTDYERIVYLQGPGVLLDASALDSLLAFSKSEPMAAFPASPDRTSISTSMFMIHPSTEHFHQLRDIRATGPMADLDLLRQSFPAPESLISEWSLSIGNFVYESQNLRNAVDGFNATLFEKATTYVRLSDPELPGPEFDIPYDERAALHPENEEARETWKNLYERFRQRRMEVCGLDLMYQAESELPPAVDVDQDQSAEVPEV